MSAEMQISIPSEDLISGKVVRLPLAAPGVQERHRKPYDFRLTGEDDTHVAYTLMVSKKLLVEHYQLFASIINVVSGEMHRQRDL